MSTPTQTPSTAAPDPAQPATPPLSTFPVLRYRDLRGLAEYASGVRCSEPVWLAACGDGVIQHVADPASPDGLPPNVWLVRTEVGDGRGNRDSTQFARIGREPGEWGSVDLLEIPFRGELKAGDSVFWTQSAVEKFMVPYYASVYAGEAATMIGAILGLLGSKQSISGEIEGTQYEVFAVIHLPQSEYVGVNEASALPGDLAVGLRAPDGTHRAVHVWDLV
jgi:hypothetical protein